MSPQSTYERIYAVVRRIPWGCVASYGQVARAAGLPGHARQVGYALAAVRDPSVPWQRVINAKGQISPRGDSEAADIQRRMLQAEGVELDAKGRIDFVRFGWRG